MLKLHHLEPFAAGGLATVENLSLRCLAQNRHEAELFFGASVLREARSTYAHQLGPDRVARHLPSLLHEPSSPVAVPA